jgi:hypothetical protein
VARGVRGVADHEDLGMPGHGEIGTNDDAADAILLDAQPVGGRRGSDTGRPDDGRGLQPFVADGHTLLVAFGHRLAQAHLDMQARERAQRRVAERRREGRQHARARFDQHDARVARIDGAEVVAQRDMGELGDGARHLHARRAGADHHERQETPARFGVVGLLGLFEGRQDAAADEGGVVDLLQRRRHALPLVVAEIGVSRAGGQHQHVVGDFAVLQLHDAALAVDAAHPAQDHPHVCCLAQDGADGLGDLRRRQTGRGHLIEQRLEEMVVALVDHGDVGIGAGQVVRGAQAAETGADDDDVRTGHRDHQTGRRDNRRTSQRVRGPNSASVK